MMFRRGARRLGLAELGLHIDGWVRLASPPQCASCKARIDVPIGLCRACGRRVERQLGRPRRQWLCGSPGDLIPDGRLMVLACGPLRGSWGRVVRAFKEDPSPEVNTLAVSQMARALRRTLRFRGEAEPRGVLAPVPMSRVRRRERGFNPAEVLAVRLAERCDRPCVPALLTRIRYARPLRGLSARQRRREVQDAFALTAGVEPPAAVWLVDDVVTTGATLRAAAVALGRAGIPVRGAVVLGRTPRRVRAGPGVRRSVRSTGVPVRPEDREIRTGEVIPQEATCFERL